MVDGMCLGELFVSVMCISIDIALEHYEGVWSVEHCNDCFHNMGTSLLFSYNSFGFVNSGKYKKENNRMK